MSDIQNNTSLNRRKALALIGGGGGLLLADRVSAAMAQDASAPNKPPRVYATVEAMRADADLAEGMFAQTLGYFQAGDGGAAVYEIAIAEAKASANDGDIIALANKKHALLSAGGAVNYQMFGIVGDGKNDDGVQIKLAHEYAKRMNLPVVHLGGEYWIIKTNRIPITTNVEWGNTIFHIDERYNEKRDSRFIVHSREAARAIKLDETAKAAFLKALGPGVQIIPEMAPYKNCLVSIADANDQIGFRAGEKYKGQSWNREELFYVEEDGRIIGDIAWKFQDYTKLTAYPCDDSFLTIDGGGFYLSGDNPGTKYSGYYQNGFRISRSRTIIRNQWMGLEPGRRDISMEPRSGFYIFSRVFNTLLENVRLIPWEQNRDDPKKEVGAGTYGISGGRMLNCTFRNITAEGTWLHWGVFGTNLNKNFRIEKCRLNRVDVHFHCWNLTIQDSEIGLRGISVTGGGDLLIENTTREGNSFVNFRQDFGSKWDGRIRIRDCTLKPSSTSGVSVLYSRPSDFDYRYPLGCGRSVEVDNLLIDYSAAPSSTSPCWLMRIVSFSKTQDDSRLFFPEHVSFRNIRVRGRESGVRLISIPEPYHYDLGVEGGFDGVQLQANCQMIFENIDLEDLPPAKPGATGDVHFRLGGNAKEKYADALALYPRVAFINCRGVSAYLGGSAADVAFNGCIINRVTAAIDGPLRGRLGFTDCQFQANVEVGNDSIYALDAELNTYFTNCTIHAPRVDGVPKPEQADRIDFVQINKLVRYFQLNTTLGNDLLKSLKGKNIELKPAFIAMLKSHHGLEPEQVPASESESSGERTAAR